jgi:hypothetical protein
MHERAESGNVRERARILGGQRIALKGNLLSDVVRDLVGRQAGRPNSAPPLSGFDGLDCRSAKNGSSKLCTAISGIS